MKRTWWRRNALALVALVPVTAAAVGASSFQYRTIWQASHPTRAVHAQGTSGHLTTVMQRGGREYVREVDVQIAEVRQDASLPTVAAAPGAHLVAVDLVLSADPGAVLTSCQADLLDEHGTVYGSQAGQVDPTTRKASFGRSTCVPPETPGPDVNAFTGEFEPARTPRPATWGSQLVFAIPDGVTPTRLRLYWDTPRHLLFELPR